MQKGKKYEKSQPMTHADNEDAPTLNMQESKLLCTIHC